MSMIIFEKWKYNPNVTDPDPKREHKFRFSGHCHPVKQFMKDKYSRLWCSSVNVICDI